MLLFPGKMGQNEWKRLLRNQVAEEKRRHGAEELRRWSLLALKELEQFPLFVLAQVVLLYYSLPDEVQTHDFVRKWSRSKKILLPAVAGDGLQLRCYASDEEMVTGTYHIGEPSGAVFTDYGTIDLAVVPGVAFDAEGCRLGRGKGYYDRLLPLLEAYKIGLCYSFQVAESVPSELHDVRMDKVLTEKGFLSSEHDVRDDSGTHVTV